MVWASLELILGVVMDLEGDTILKAMWAALVAMIAFLWNLARGEHKQIKKRIANLESGKVEHHDIDEIKVMLANSIAASEQRASSLRDALDENRRANQETARRVHEKVEVALVELDRKIAAQGQNILDLARERRG